jgi:hypothetical protein
MGPQHGDCLIVTGSPECTGAYGQSTRVYRSLRAEYKECTGASVQRMQSVLLVWF